MDLVAPLPLFNLYNDALAHPHRRQPLPPGQVRLADRQASRRIATDSMVCHGCIISGGHIDRTILGPEVYVEHDTHVKESVLFAGVRVGRGTRLHRCIIDKDVVIPPGHRIGFDAESDRERFTVSDRGVVVVEKDRNLLAD